MGASDFMVYGVGTDAREVFNRLVEDAQYEYGHGGYTGTIAEKNGYKIVAEPMTKEEGKKKAYEMIEDNDKWGPAYCIPLKDEKGVQKGFLFFGLASD